MKKKKKKRKSYNSDIALKLVVTGALKPISLFTLSLFFVTLNLKT